MCADSGGTQSAGKVVSVNVSEIKHVPKRPVREAVLRPELGVVGDAHSGPGDRQVSLLAIEAIESMRSVLSRAAAEGRGSRCPKGGDMLAPGGFAENLTIAGLNLASMPIGTRLRIGKDVELEVTKIGKECHRRCAIYEAVGSCIMPKQGIFAKVITGGSVRPDDEVRIEKRGDTRN